MIEMIWESVSASHRSAPTDDSVSNRWSRPLSKFPLSSRNSFLLGLIPRVATREIWGLPKLTTGVEPSTTPHPDGICRRTILVRYSGSMTRNDTFRSTPTRYFRSTRELAITLRNSADFCRSSDFRRHCIVRSGSRCADWVVGSRSHRPASPSA